MDKAQQLFGPQPRPVAEVEPLLSACRAAGSMASKVYETVLAKDSASRATLPVTERLARQLSVVHNSVNANTRALVGLRSKW